MKTFTRCVCAMLRNGSMIHGTESLFHPRTIIFNFNCESSEGCVCLADSKISVVNFRDPVQLRSSDCVNDTIRIITDVSIARWNIAIEKVI